MIINRSFKDFKFRHRSKKNQIIYTSKKVENDGEILNLIENNLLTGCANITGGGLADNISRIIPEKLCAEIDLSKIKTLKIFKWLKSKKISDQEMIQTFNCGIGFCIIASRKNIEKIKKIFPRKYMPYEIGFISRNKNKINFSKSLKW